MSIAAPPEDYRDALAASGGALLSALSGLESALRRLHPPEIGSLRAGLAPVLERLITTRRALEAAEPPDGLVELHRHFAWVLDLAAGALERFVEPAPPHETAPRMLEAMRRHARAQEALYPLRRVFPPVGAWFLEPAARSVRERLDPEDPPEGTGLHVAGEPDARGGFHLYVPESCAPDAAEARPLIVALHGGFGHGRDFLWSWLREAKSRRCLLLAPTSFGTTWSLHGADRDGPALRSRVAWVQERWRVDPERILLTGLSDGATYTLLGGLAEGSPFRALAPLSGVLHPGNFANGNLTRAAGRPVYLVHGALDWMFPVALAREADRVLREAGAHVTFREVEDLSHTYAREENARILDWLGAELEPC